MTFMGRFRPSFPGRTRSELLGRGVSPRLAHLLPRWLRRVRRWLPRKPATAPTWHTQYRLDDERRDNWRRPDAPRQDWWTNYHEARAADRGYRLPGRTHRW